MTFDLLENRRDLFPIVAPEPSLYIHNKKSSRSRARGKRRYLIACQVRDTVAALNALHDDSPLTRRALFDIKLPTARRKTRSPAVQENVLSFIRDRCRAAWRRGLLSPRESMAWPRLGGYAPLVRDSSRPQQLDVFSKDKISLPPAGLAAGVPILDVLPPRLRSVYRGTASVVTPNQAALRQVKPCLMVQKGHYAPLIQKLLSCGLVELTREKPKEINGMFAVPKDKGAKQRLILDARRANMHFI